MNNQTNVKQLLTDHLDIWLSAENEKKSGRGRASGNKGTVYGVQKLRKLILELAVRGKLVPQDASDEPASELLKRIQAEKAKLIAEGKLKKEKPLAPIDEDEKPFQAPLGWEWVRVDEVGHDWGQKTPNQEFTYIEVSAIDNHRGLVLSPEVVKPEDAPSRARKVVKQNTIIYSTVRPYLLNIAIIDTEFKPEPIASTAFAIIHPYCEMSSRYFLYYLRSPVFIQYVESVQTGIAYPAINDGQFYSGLLALPPLNEQHRIVAKVDELMAICEQLEQQHSNAQQAHETLVNILLGTLTQSQNANEFQSNWQRIAAHFETLFTTQTSIDALKQTLLQLAVMGKLVPQDPNDEPASELLKRIQTEKAKLITEGKLKKEKPLAPISEDEKPYDLPKGWEFVRLIEIIKISSGDGLTAAQMDSDGKIPVFGGNGINGYHNESNINQKTLVIGRVGYYCGSIHITPENAWVTDNAFITKFSESNIFLDFLYWLLKITNLKENDNATAQPVISGAKIYPIVVALPPLTEQHRIIAKVDALMALCDQLKTRIQQASQQQQLIADALVAQAVD